MKEIITTIILTLLVNITYCCTCLQLEKFSIEREFQDRDVVFEGTLIQIDTINTVLDSITKFSVDEIWYTFQVTEYFKGEKNQKIINIKSGISNSHDCKFIFLMGESYIVYANHPLNKQSKKNKTILETSVCTNTGKATAAKYFEAKNQK